MTMDVEGYEELAVALNMAYDQSARGKGKERHANSKPFVDQPIFEISRMVGLPGLSYQVCKKAQEATGMAARGETNAAVAEFLGVIVYSAAAVNLIAEMSDDYDNIFTDYLRNFDVDIKQDEREIVWLVPNHAESFQVDAPADTDVVIHGGTRYERVGNTDAYLERSEDSNLTDKELTQVRCRFIPSNGEGFYWDVPDDENFVNHKGVLFERDGKSLTFRQANGQYQPGTRSERATLYFVNGDSVTMTINTSSRFIHYRGRPFERDGFTTDFFEVESTTSPDSECFKTSRLPDVE